MSFHARLSSSVWTPNTLPEANRDPRITYPLASGVCSFKMNVPKMPAEGDRWEARNYKETDKYTSTNSGLHIATAFFFIIFSREWKVLFSVWFFCGEKRSFIIFFLFFQNTLEQSDSCQETADKSQQWSWQTTSKPVPFPPPFFLPPSLMPAPQTCQLHLRSGNHMSQPFIT